MVVSFWLIMWTFTFYPTKYLEKTLKALSSFHNMKLLMGWFKQHFFLVWIGNKFQLLLRCSLCMCVSLCSWEPLWCFDVQKESVIDFQAPLLFLMHRLYELFDRKIFRRSKWVFNGNHDLCFSTELLQKWHVRNKTILIFLRSKFIKESFNILFGNLIT